MKNLSHFYLDLPLKQMQIFADLPKLSELEIRGIWNHDCGMNQLLMNIHKLSHLVYLNLSDGSEIDVAAFHNLSKLPTLRELTIQIVPFKPAFLETIGMLTQLEYLFVNHVPEITNASLVFLTALTQLKAINLCDNEKLGDECFSYVSHLTRLTNLGLSNVGLKTVRKLSIFQDLKDLELHACRQIFDIELEPLSKLTSLIDLTITDTSMNVNAMWCLTSLTRLTKLDLSDNDFLDGNIAPPLLNFPRLKNINLSGTRASKQALLDIKSALRPWKFISNPNNEETDDQ
jgi:hypothetical protein